MTTALITILAIFIIGMMIPQFLVRSFLGPGFRLFVVPGVILHELSHAAACLLTGAQIQRIRFFKKDGGDVTHTQSPVPVIGQLIITMAPLFIGLAAVLFMASKVIPNLSHLHAGGSIVDFPSFFMQVIKSIKWMNPAAWVWMYLIISVGATMTPSIKDFTNSTIALLAIVVAIIFIYRNHGWRISADHIATTILPYLSVALFILLVLAAISLILWLLSGIFGINR